MKIVGLRRLGDMEDKLQQQFKDVNFIFTDGVSEVKKEDQADVDIIFGYDGNISQSFIEQCPQLKWIAWYSTGVNTLPLEYIEENNILLTNGRGIHAKQMAEFIIGFILDDYKMMRTSYDNQKNRKYDSTITAPMVKGEHILFLGTGNIAQRTTTIAKALGLHITGVNTSGRSVEDFEKTYAIDDLNEALEEADIVVNTLPETEKTIHLLNQGHFERMKDTALFINVGRGTIVKEEIIINALKDRLIRYAYLDVFENEPLEPNNPLYDLDNVTLTAHITGNGANHSKEATLLFMDNLSHFLNYGKLIENEVKPQYGY